MQGVSGEAAGPAGRSRLSVMRLWGLQARRRLLTPG